MDSINRNTSPTDGSLKGHPLSGLSREDLDLITRLTLHSGSLKALAKDYGVSYPTIRARLDRTIERLQQVLEGRTPDPLSELLADLVSRGELSRTSAQAIRDTARRDTHS
ncbi:MAG: DUF2089 family protein [Phycisphaerales bacterium]